ncbi:hypothetical protein B0H13DRAFT_1979714 [Mycena leptocephala]|nr:hypothetical protein B0H13DRAFT_1979714 [Mycena leptocephala]
MGRPRTRTRCAAEVITQVLPLLVMATTNPLLRWTRRATTGLARLLLTAAATSEVAEDASPFWLAATVVKASIVTFCGNSTGVGSLEVWPI